MKLKAKTKHGWLAEVSEDEVGHLCGHYNHNEVDVKIGSNIAIDAMFSRLYALKSQQRELNSAAVALERAAALTREVAPIFVEPA